MQSRDNAWDLWATGQGSPSADHESLQRLMTLIYNEQLLHLQNDSICKVCCIISLQRGSINMYCIIHNNCFLIQWTGNPDFSNLI
jgi:hypothetical protein